MCSSFRNVLTVFFLVHYTCVTAWPDGYHMHVMVLPPCLVENLCVRVETVILNDGYMHESKLKNPTTRVYVTDEEIANHKEDERVKEVNKEVFEYTIRNNYQEWKMRSKEWELIFGWVVKNSTFPYLFIRAGRRVMDDIVYNKSFTPHEANVTDFALELVYRKKAQNVVPFKKDIVMQVTYKGQKELEKSFRFATYWYEDCKVLDIIENNYLVHKFNEPDTTYQISVAIELVFNGDINETSPYDCDTNTLTPPPAYTPQVMVPPEGGKLFKCEQNDDLFCARAVTRMNVITIDPSDFTKGHIILTQKGKTHDDFVTTRDPVTLSLELEGKDKERFQRSVNNSVYWYGNCELLNETDGATLEHTFWEHQKYELVAVVLSYFVGSKVETNPYDCNNNRLQLQHYLCAAGVFRKNFNVRETLITNATLSLTQKGKPRQRFVSVDDPSTVTIKLEGKAELNFGKTSSKTFWFQDCKLMGTSYDKKFQFNFKKAEMEYKVSALIVVTHSGSHPRNAPYNCLTDKLKTDYDHAVGVFHSLHYTRDLWIPVGEVRLLQHGFRRDYYVAHIEAFNLSIVLDAKGRNILRRTNPVVYYWFADCELLGSTEDELYEYNFYKAFHKYKIAGVLVGMYNGTPPITAPYDCSTKKIIETVTRAVGAFEGEFFARVSRLNTTNGKVLLQQSGYNRSYIVSPNLPITLSIKLNDVVDKEVFKNTKSNKTFWYSNCKLIGESSKSTFLTSLDKTFQKYKVVGVLVAMYEGATPLDPPYNCTSKTLIDNVDYVVGAFEGGYFTRVIRIPKKMGIVVLTQSDLIRDDFVDIEEPFYLNIKVDKKYSDLVQKAFSSKTFWYSNCKRLGESFNASLKHKWDEAFHKYEIVGVLVACHKGSAPIEAPYDCAKHKLKENEDCSVGAFQSTYTTRATKLDNGDIIFRQKGVTRSETVATDNLNMSLQLSLPHERAMHHGKAVRIFWHRNCTLIGVSAGPLAQVVFRKPFRTHEIVAVLVAVHEGPPPKISPYICEDKKVKLDIRYTIATFFGTITTKDPIRNVKIEGETTLRESETLKLRVSFTGTPPYEYSIMLTEAPHKRSFKGDSRYENVKTNNNAFEYEKKFDAGDRQVTFIIKNEVSVEVVPVLVNVFPVLLANLKCLGGCN